MKRCVAFLVATVVAPSILFAGQNPSAQDALQLYQRSMELYGSGRYDEALSPAERALAISSSIYGPEHPDVALMLNGVALICVAKGDYSRAEPLYERALAIYSKLAASGRLESTRKAATGNVATTLNNLAELYRTKGEYARAERFYERALAIVEGLSGPEAAEVATTLNNLANLYRAEADYARAEPLFRRALKIYAKVEGTEHPDVALVLNNLGAIYQDRGDYDRAEPLYLRALAIREKALGKEHPDVASTLSNLAELYGSKGEYARAQQLHIRALAIYVKASGRDHPDVAISLNNLAALYLETGDYAHAEPLYQRALEINIKALGPEHPEVSRSLNNLAAVAHGKGDDARAESLYLRALAIREKVLGPQHPLVATTLNNLAELYKDKGDIERAVQMCARGLEVRERNFNLVLASGSEDQKQLYLDTVSGETQATVSLHVRSAPANPQAALLALTTILRRKGRALDAMTDQIAALRRHAGPGDTQLLDELASARSKLATLQLSSSRMNAVDRQAAVARLSAEASSLEDQVSRRSAEFRSLSQPVTVDAVRQALPADAALVEIVAFKPFNSKAVKAFERFGPAQYVAYVLKRDSTTPQFVELGDVKSIDAEVAKLRDALHDPGRKDVKELARGLDERVMKPVRRLLGSIHNVLLSPDGALNLIPFAALVDERGHYLVENYTLSYLTSGRDLVRLQVARESLSVPLVIGDPLYDISTGQASATGQPIVERGQKPSGRRSIDFTALTYEPLPGTAQEAHSLESLLPRAQVLLQRQATEAALKQARAPRILHIATHGFFLADLSKDSSAESRALLHQGQRVAPQKENPLLRSGIVLAGVKQQQSGPGEDGVLTALEAAGLNLWGTQLVVLSACETGLGEVRNGAGVYGLRRALVIAGSETQVISLWSVNDAATRDLMTGFYKRLQAGEGRAEALRHVQLAMLAGNSPDASGDSRKLNVKKDGYSGTDNSHPFYWAPFIESGAWTSIRPSR